MFADVHPPRLARRMAGWLALIGGVGHLLAAPDGLQSADLAARSGPAGATLFTVGLDGPDFDDLAPLKVWLDWRASL